MKKTFIFISLLILCSACTNGNQKGVEDSQKMNKQAELIALKNSPYLALFQNDSPLAIVFSLNDYANPDKEYQQNTILRNWDTNNYYLDSIDNAIITRNDTCLVNRSEDSTSYYFRKKTTFKISTEDDGGGVSASSDTTYTVQRVEPIHITKPQFDYCQRIPYCWYHDMVIEWNEYEENPNGVLIFSWCSGTSLFQTADEDSNTPPVWHVTLVEDNGRTTIDDSMFADMPEWGIVSIILVRANILTVVENDEVVFINQNEAPSTTKQQLNEFFESYLADNFRYVEQSYSYMHASVAKMTMILVRDSYSN